MSLESPFLARKARGFGFQNTKIGINLGIRTKVRGEFVKKDDFNKV
jgi:hypothetical protein